MQIQVVKNAKRNIIFGTFNKVVVMLCPFVQRTIIQAVLGAQYLGLSSLYTSILSVLSLAELGFNSAMVYNMYKPVAEGNTERVNALLAFYRKVYKVIGCVILALGTAVIPFLGGLIKGEYPGDINIVGLYLVYLINAAVSYFLFAYMTSILVVHQRDDIQSTVNAVVSVVMTVMQAGALILTRNYYYFAALMPAFTILNNLWVARRVHRLFPQYRPEGQISHDDRQSISRLVAGTFIQRACAVTRNSLDSICISAFLGLTLTAIYNNYYMIAGGITAMLGVVSAAFMGGVGNHVAIKDVEDNFQELLNLDFVYLWIGGWCSICLACLYQPFMRLWMGERMMLDYPTVILLVLYFYLLKLGDMRTLYSSALGLWWEQRYRSISETLLNLTLNIVLGRLFGVRGIIAATMISLFLCNYIWSTRIVFKHYFGMERCKKYYLAHAGQTVVALFSGALTFGLCTALKTTARVPLLFLRAAICIAVPNAIFIAVFCRTARFKYALHIITRR